MVLNSTDTHNAPVYLKQSVPMMVVYTLAYSAVFFLGINLSNLDLVNSVIKYHLGGIFFLISPPGSTANAGSYCASVSYLFTSLFCVRPFSTSTGPIFTRFTGLLELQLYMNI